MIDRRNPPAFRAINKIDLPQARSQKLANGLYLHWLHAGEQPVVRIEFIFRAGNWAEPQKGVSYFTTKMMNEGTTSMTARQINEYVDQFGAFMEFNHGQDKVNVTVYTLSKYLDKILPLLKEIILESVFPVKELENLKKITTQNLKVNQEKTAYLAQTRFRELLFGASHPYGRNLQEKDIQQIEQGILKEFYYANICRQPCDIILSGFVDENMLSLVRNTFEDIHFSERKFIEKDPFLADKNKPQELLEKPESLQSSIRLGRLLFTRSHPDYFKMQVLNEVLGGYFGSRLMKNIREDKGFTYGISSNFATYQQQGYLVIGTDVKKEFTQLTLIEIHKEMDILRNELIEEEELQTVKNYMLGSFAGSLNTPFALADHFKAIYFDGLTYDFYNQYVEKILHTTSQELLELANQYLHPESMLEVVVGGK